MLRTLAPSSRISLVVFSIFHKRWHATHQESFISTQRQRLVISKEPLHEGIKMMTDTTTPVQIGRAFKRYFSQAMSIQKLLTVRSPSRRLLECMENMECRDVLSHKCCIIPLLCLGAQLYLIILETCSCCMESRCCFAYLNFDIVAASAPSHSKIASLSQFWSLFSTDPNLLWTCTVLASTYKFFMGSYNNCMSIYIISWLHVIFPWMSKPNHMKLSLQTWQPASFWWHSFAQCT